MNVMETQLGLKALGFSPGAIDGVWGAKSRAAARKLLDKLGITRVILDNQTQVAVEQLIMREIGGLAVGPIDGIVGPATIKARKHWLHGPWRNALMDEQFSDVRMPDAVRTTWPKQSEMERVFGAAGTNIVMAQFAYPMRLSWELNTTVHRFQVNAKVAQSATRIFQKTLAHYGHDRIRELRLDLFGGCFALRNMRGGTSLSTHAYGAAIDLDPARNALNWGRDRAAFARPEYEGFWDAVTSEGWLSLGKARDFDWMHFQAARLG